MRFSTRNVYYLRISAHTILPLYLYLDEQHVEWMSDRVLQHVLEDLRFRIPEKLIKEADIQLGASGAGSGSTSANTSSKKQGGSLDVHRGDTYQFGYFLRKTEPHAVLIKTRNFVAAPPRPAQPRKPKQSSPKPTSELPSTSKSKRKRTAPPKRKKLPTSSSSEAKSNKKRKTKGKGKAVELDSDEEEEEEYDIPEDEAREDEDIIDLSSGDDDAVQTTRPVQPEATRRSTRNRTVKTGGYREIDVDQDEDKEEELGDLSDTPPAHRDEDVVMGPSDAVEAPPAFDDSGLIAMDDEDGNNDLVASGSKSNEVDVVKTEDMEVQLEPPPSSQLRRRLPSPSPSPPPPREPSPPAVQLDNEVVIPSDIEEDEKEQKPKPILKLKYEGFTIHGRCLCVIVEPYPPFKKNSGRAVSLQPTGLRAPRAPSIAPADYVPPSVAARQRERTPLFLPDDDDDIRAGTPAPPRIRPPVPLFHEDPPEEEDDDDRGGMYEFSQMLQSVGDHTAIAADEDDEIDGSVFFGDADETREL